MTVVWISDTNYHKILRTLIYLWISQRIIAHLRSYIQNSTQCFIRYPDTSKLVLKISAAPRFSIHFSVSGYRMKHCVSFWIYYFRNDLCTLLAWPSRKSVSKLWMHAAATSLFRRDGPYIAQLLEGNYFSNAARSRITTNLQQEVRDYVYTFMYP